MSKVWLEPSDDRRPPNLARGLDRNSRILISRQRILYQLFRRYPAVFLKPSCRPHKVKQLHESGTSMVASKPAMLLCPQTSWGWQGTGRSLPASAIKASAHLSIVDKEHDEFCFTVCCREKGTVAGHLQ